jgi:hypothetical protein
MNLGLQKIYKMGISEELNSSRSKGETTPPIGFLWQFRLIPMHRSSIMFQAFKRSWVAFFGTTSNVFESLEFVTDSARTISEELALTTKLESGSNVHLLTKQLAALDAA